MKVVSITLEFVISIFFTFSAMLRLIRVWPVVYVTDGVNRIARRKPPPNAKSLVTFSHVPDEISTQAVVRDS